MDTRQAILAFSQSEKAKSALIMATQLMEIYNGLPEPEKHCAERFIRSFLGMITSEISVAKKMTPADMWTPVDKSLNTAFIMMNSGVLSEASYHITQAISAVTTIGQRSMQFLLDQKLL
jgi:hypothetical protein